MATETLTHTGKDGKGILITEPAMKQLANLMQQQGSGSVLRVGVRSADRPGLLSSVFASGRYGAGPILQKYAT